MLSGFPVADGLGGVHGAFAVMLALFERERTGRGQLVDLALFEPVLRMLDGVVTAGAATGTAPPRVGNHNRDIAPNSLYRTRDDEWVVLPVSSPNMWARFVVAIERPDLADDPRFATNPGRVRHRAELEAVLVPILAAWDLAPLLEHLRRHGVAAGPVNSVLDVLADEDLWSRGVLVAVPDPDGGDPVHLPGPVPRLSRTPGEVHRPGPEPGRHTVEVLTPLLGTGEVARLLASGAIGAPGPAGAPVHPA